MNHVPSLPSPSRIVVCVKCCGRLAVSFMRQLGTDDSGNPIYQCRNQAACRKRERELQAKAAKGKTS